MDEVLMNKELTTGDKLIYLFIKSQGGEVHMRGSDISDALGLSGPDVVSRMISRLAKNGVIEKSYGTYRIIEKSDDSGVA